MMIDEPRYEINEKMLNKIFTQALSTIWIQFYSQK